MNNPGASTVPLIPLIKRKLHNLVSDEKFSEILTGSVWALGARVLATLFALATSVIIARAYGADMMGILAVVTSFVAISTIFTLLGTNTSILRMIPEHMSRYSVSSAYTIYRKTQYFVGATSILVGAALLAGAPFIADKLFTKPHLAFYLAVSAAFVWARSLMDLNTQAVRGLRFIRTFAFMQILPHLVMLLLLAGAAAFWQNRNAPVYAQLGAWALTAAVGAVIMTVGFRSHASPGDIVCTTPMKSILSVASPMFISASMMFVIANTGVIILGIYRSEEEVGYYSAAVKLATMTTFILNSINSMAAPKFSELFHTGRIDELFHVARKSSKLIFWTTLPILLALVSLGIPILSLLFGRAFVAAYPALVLLATGEFVNSVSGSTGFFMNMTGQEKVLRNIVVGTCALNILLNFASVPSLGILGSALAAAVSTSLWNVAVLLYIKRKYGRTIGYLPGVPI